MRVGREHGLSSSTRVGCSRTGPGSIEIVLFVWTVGRPKGPRYISTLSVESKTRIGPDRADRCVALALTVSLTA